MQLGSFAEQKIAYPGAISESIETSGTARPFAFVLPRWKLGRLKRSLVPPPAAEPGCAAASFHTSWLVIALAALSSKFVPPIPVTHHDDEG